MSEMPRSSRRVEADEERMQCANQVPIVIALRYQRDAEEDQGELGAKRYMRKKKIQGEARKVKCFFIA